MTDAETERAARRLGAPLRDRTLLLAALAVPAPRQGRADPLVQTKERLEYLGDSVIGFLVADHLVTALPDAGEGVLSALRAATVSAASLAAIAEALDVPAALGRPERREERGRSRLLASTLEALTGAVYQEAGLAAVRAWLGPHLAARAEALLAGGYLPPKSRLQERTQHGGRGTPAYHLLATSGAEHARTFEVEVLVEGRPLGRGRGPSRRAAEQAAAAAALERLG